jgi:hypothetical protein
MLFLCHHLAVGQEVEFFFPCLQLGVLVNPPVFTTMGIAHAFRKHVKGRVVFALKTGEELVQGQG